MRQVDAVIIGGGPAGLAAAIELKKKGVEDILILEREKKPGGILRQCIHDGFGLTRFGETLSGPEYASRFVKQAEELSIPCMTDTTVLEITPDRKVYASSSEGFLEIQARAVILAMGCRERTRGAISIPGTRPAGVYTAGVAQAYINLKNKMVGRNVVILGSGDIGMIMARRMTLEGAKVLGVFEIQPYPSGLPRNVEQCLNDYHIPLYLSHSVTDIRGRDRLESVVVSQVDEHLSPIPGTEKEYACDTLILSVGLIPENELTKEMGISMSPVTSGPQVSSQLETSVEGVFACGNVLHVHDLVDYVSEEAALAGENAVEYMTAEHEGEKADPVVLKAENGVRYTVPQFLDVKNMKDKVTVRFRVADVYRDRFISVYYDHKRVVHRKKRVLAPGEMEQIVIKKESLADCPDLKNIIICTEVD